MKLLIVLDDTVKKSEIIEDVIGEKGFSDVVVKRKRLGDYYHEALMSVFGEFDWKIIHSFFEYKEWLLQLEQSKYDTTRVLHCYANYVITDKTRAALTFRKISFVDADYLLLARNEIAGIVFPDIDNYRKYIKRVCGEENSLEASKQIQKSISIDGLTDIGKITNFIQCITGEFDSRYFNAFEERDYTLVKKSHNKEKIKAEYSFWHLLPDDMKRWFVMPYHYEESEEYASYTMERLYMTDLAVKWVHGSIGEKEFYKILDMYFAFFNSRHKRNITAEEYRSISETLYLNKVQQRIDSLKQLPAYAKISVIFKNGTGRSVDDLFALYLKLKTIIEKRFAYPNISVVGHGDPCFSNTMYNRATRTLKFIDPKGALKEEDLWTNPYYDLAKLSHSICGRYDFFNSGLYDITVGNDLSLQLSIHFDNENYKKIFREKVEENHFDYWSIRIYEASLFLSMLPLHIDNPNKVLGFMLNVKTLLEEIEENV